MSKIRVAIAGVGNCASALIQGVEYYKNTDDEPIGVASELGGYTISDLEFVVGFDVHKDKIGKTLGKAIFVEPNCTEFLWKADSQKGQVLKGKILDGLESAIKDFVPINEAQNPVDVESVLRDKKIDVLVILLPTGSQQAAEYYTRAALAAGCAIVNGIPATIANNDEFVKLAEENASSTYQPFPDSPCRRRSHYST
jgi:myo-inositol-1-phosphate synthase